MPSRVHWVVGAACLCVLAVLLWLRTPTIPGDPRTVTGYFRCAYVALAALVCAATGAYGIAGGRAVVGAFLGLYLLLALCSVFPPSLLIIWPLLLVLFLGGLGCLVHAVLVLIQGAGDATRNWGHALAGLALAEAIFSFYCGLMNGWL